MVDPLPSAELYLRRHEPIDLIIFVGCIVAVFSRHSVIFLKHLISKARNRTSPRQQPPQETHLLAFPKDSQRTPSKIALGVAA